MLVRDHAKTLIATIAVLALLVLPIIGLPGWALGLCCQVAVALVLCQSYHLLLKQAGMLSFAHIVFSATAAYAVVHLLRGVTSLDSVWVVVLAPLLGGVAAAAMAWLMGWLATWHGGTALAMITLGLGELAFLTAWMLPHAFGGESGLSANRVGDRRALAFNLSALWQVYAVLWVYAVLSTVVLMAFLRTPLGLLARAVRDNATRLPFTGYEPRRIRHRVFVVAGFWAGVAGGMSVLHLEIATPEMFNPLRTAQVLIFTFLGGMHALWGPIVGAVWMVLSHSLVSVWSRAWLLTLGVVFIVVVWAMPDGFTAPHLWRRLRGDRSDIPHTVWCVFALVLTGLMGLLGVAWCLEMIYHLRLEASLKVPLSLLGRPLDSADVDVWVGAGLWTATALVLFESIRRHAWPTAKVHRT